MTKPFLLKRVSTSDVKEDMDEALDLAPFLLGVWTSAFPEECNGLGVVPPRREAGLIGVCPLGVRGLNEGLDL